MDAETGGGYEGYNLLLVKYSSAGELLWKRTYNHPGSASFEWGTSVAVGPDGSVYVTGSTFSGHNEYRPGLLLLKYSPAGRRLWIRIQRPSSGRFESGEVVAARGGVYVSARFHGLLDGKWGEAIQLQEFSPSGTLQWTRLYDAAPREEFGGGLGLGRDGSVYLTGGVQQPTASNPSAWAQFLLRYSPNGSLLWSGTFPSPAPGLSVGCGGMAMNSAGEVFAPCSVYRRPRTWNSEQWLLLRKFR